MADITDAALTTITPVTTALETAKPADITSTIDKVQRIVDSITALTENFVNLQNRGNSPKPAAKPRNDEMNRDEHFARGRENKTGGKVVAENNAQTEIVRTIVNNLGVHVDKCWQEDPKMPLIEMISGIDFTAEQCKFVLGVFNENQS